eukprot:13050818-Ditylum_brightwellii.AAC.1
MGGIYGGGTPGRSGGMMLGPYFPANLFGNMVVGYIGWEIGIWLTGTLRAGARSTLGLTVGCTLGTAIGCTLGGTASYTLRI